MSLPYYQMYPRDFEGDADVIPLTSSERGLYFWCLNRSWMDDGLPETQARISLLLPAAMLGSFATDWPAIEQFFPWARDKRRRNPRQESERAKAQQKSKTNKSNALTRYERSSSSDSVRSQVVALRASDSDDDSDSVSESSSSDSEKVRNIKILRFDDDEKTPTVEYATPQDELKALILEKTGSPLPGTDLAWITEQLELRRMPLPGFIAEVRKHKANKWKNPIGMLKSLVRKCAIDIVPLALPETKAAMEDRTYRCPRCASTKRGEGLILGENGALPCECASPEFITHMQARGILGGQALEKAN